MMEFLAMFKEYLGIALIVAVATAAIIIIAKCVTRSVFTQIEQYHNKRDEKVIKLAITYVGAICGIFVQTFKEGTKIIDGKPTTAEELVKMMFEEL